MQLIIKAEEKYVAKEWSKETSDESKHRVYVSGPNGEIGWFNVSTGEFINSEKASELFGHVSLNDAKITLESPNGLKIHLGNITSYRESGPRDRLKDAVKKMATLNIDNNKVEINLGPTVELKVNGKSHWAKANLTVGAENVEDIEELYDVVSEMASAMLDLEINKISER
tara:strand:+ start:776 stop:1285 length:510 start_codon:yes stop_codon:yes gene_type:complete